MSVYDREYMRGGRGPRWLEFMWPDAVTFLIIVNVAVFVVQHVFGKLATDVIKDGQVVTDLWGGLSIRALAEGRIWTVVTHMFVHQTLFHILGNCLMIYFAGKSVQSLLGPRHFLYIYFVSGVVGAAMQLAVDRLHGVPAGIELIGASGCGFGVFFALAVMLPQEVITALIYFIIPVRIKLWNLARLLLGVSIIFGAMQIFQSANNDHIAHFAHIGGALAGWYIVRLLGYGGKAVTYDRLWRERLQREQSPEFAGVKNRRRVVDMDEPEWTLPSSLTAREFIEQEIDPILDKIGRHGIGSLTDAERKLLERASLEILSRDKK